MTGAPLFLDGHEAPPGGTAHWLTTHDGVRIRAGAWNSGRRGTVFIFPGRSEYVEKYMHVALAAHRAGYASLSVDWRGQGLADRLLPDRAVGHVERFTDYQADVAAVAELARNLGLPEPWYMIAHSMGACIGLRALMEGFPAQAVAFSGPMFGIRMAPALRPVAWAVGLAARVAGQSSRYTPTTTGAQVYVQAVPFAANLLTTDRSMYDFMQGQLARHPELGIGGPSLHWLIEALSEVRALAARPSPRLPCYCAMGSREALADPAAVRDRMARWPGAEFEVIPGALHELLMETPERRAQYLDKALGLFASCAVEA